MRGAFVNTLIDLAERDSRILLLTGDLGFAVLEPFAERFPGRFFNVGVAEQNMVGLSVGLAQAGFIPFVYSIATFASLRPYEFIRNGPLLHRLPVRIVGMGGGFDYGTAGITHYALEDVGVLRLQPRLTLICPADREQTRTALLATWDLPGPIYYRLNRDGNPAIPGLGGRFELGRAQLVRQGADLLFVAMGSIAGQVVAAATELQTRGVTCSILVIAILNPCPTEDLHRELSHFRVVLTVEEHYAVGGLGSLVAETVAAQGLACRVVRCGVECMPDGVIGSQDYLRGRYRLSWQALVDSALTALETPP